MIEKTVCIGALPLENGTVLPAVEQRVTIYGDAAEDGGNVVLIPHALTGSSRVMEWWPGIAGPGAFFDPAHWCVVGINALGSCYGSTQPSGATKFPRITIRDIVRAQRMALTALGLSRLAVVTGGSVGGMQAFQWALDAPHDVGRAVIIGAHDRCTPMAVALNAIQRECIELDPERGLGLARKVAMLTYKSEDLLETRHGRRRDRTNPDLFDVEGYLNHQAHKFRDRMESSSYVALTHAMDSFDVRDRVHDECAPLSFIGISSDWLFRPRDIEETAHRFNAPYFELASDHGHDAFLAEASQVAELLGAILNEKETGPRSEPVSPVSDGRI